PGIFHRATVVGQHHIGILNNVGKLKNNAQYKPRNVMHNEKTQKNFPPNNIEKKQRNYNPQRNVNYFSNNQNAPLGKWIWQFSVRKFTGQISFGLKKIGSEKPVEG